MRMPTETLTEPDPVEEAAIRLDNVIRTEIDAIAQGARELAARSRKLGDKGRGANGLKGASEVWSREFEKMAGDISSEGPEVSKSLLGKGVVEIQTIVNPELATAVSSDPERKR